MDEIKRQISILAKALAKLQTEKNSSPNQGRLVISSTSHNYAVKAQVQVSLCKSQDYTLVEF